MLEVSRPMSAPLVYVWIGEKLPLWASDSLKITKKICGVETILLTNRSVDRCISSSQHLYIEDFYSPIKPSALSKVHVDNFRDGFWLKTLERFLVLKAFMKAYGVQKILHAELDNIVFNIDGLSEKLDEKGQGFFCPRDSLIRGIASLVYINSPNSMDCFEQINLAEAGIQFNDMTFLGEKLQSSKQFISLPTENSLESDASKGWEFIDPLEVGGIFDAASIGQYLFGIDTRNTFFPKFNGFVNENSGSKLKDLRFKISLNDGMSFVYDQTKDIDYRLFNIHVHSKIFSQIKNEHIFNLIVNKTNLGKKTLIKRKFGYGE